MLYDIAFWLQIAGLLVLAGVPVMLVLRRALRKKERKVFSFQVQWLAVGGILLVLPRAVMTHDVVLVVGLIMALILLVRMCLGRGAA